MWRSMVAHFTGGEGVAGSNPVIPTIFKAMKIMRYVEYADLSVLLLSIFRV